MQKEIIELKQIKKKVEDMSFEELYEECKKRGII